MRASTWKVRRLMSRAVRRVRFGRLRYVVVVSYGRTGSTLLQGILMTAPNVLIRGEQGGTLRHLKSWYDELCRLQQRRTKPHAETTRRHPFFGIGGFRRDEALRRLRLLLLESLLRPRPNTAVVGFKENDWPDDVLSALQFLQGVFPGVRFVVNTRDLDAVVKSGFWAGRPGAEVAVRRRHDAILAAADRVGEAVYRVHYDEWVSEPEKLRGMFDWLGIRFDPKKVAEVMAQPHSFRNRSVDHLDPAPVVPSEPVFRPRAAVRGVAVAWAALAVVQAVAIATALAGTGPFAD